MRDRAEAPIAKKQPGHRWFAAVYDRLSQASERGFMKEMRTRVHGAALGRTLEVGFGTGISLPYYASAVDLTAVEPDQYMLEKARGRVAASGRTVKLEQAPAEELPFADDSFDSVVTTLVLCSVQSPTEALAEIRRVLKPGGRYYFYEHVRYTNRAGGWMQDAVAPAWGWIAGGCHPNRRLGSVIGSSGFAETLIERRADLPPLPPVIFVRPHILGWARKAGD